MNTVLRQMRIPIGAAWPATLPLHGAVGLTLVAVAWPVSWLRVDILGEYAFFPLWLGYVLTVDALVLRRKGTSLLTRSATAFLGMFLASVPLWWIFEGINHFTQNWHYVGGEEYSILRYVVVASLHFSIEEYSIRCSSTVELVASFTVSSIGSIRGPVVRISRRILRTGWREFAGKLGQLVAVRRGVGLAVGPFGFPKANAGEVQGKAARRAGDPYFWWSSDPFTQADAGCPAGQVVRHHLWPGAVGRSAPRACGSATP